MLRTYFVYGYDEDVFTFEGTSAQDAVEAFYAAFPNNKGVYRVMCDTDGWYNP